MISAPLLPNEEARLASLESYKILDTAAEAEYDNLCRLAAVICETPIALISLVDRDRQWFKASVGLDDRETPREIAFCAHAIWQDRVFEIPDAVLDERFKDNPLVEGNPHIRFYAGMPLVNPQGHALGTLCAIDQVPRRLTPFQTEALEILSRQVVTHLELRRTLAEVTRLNHDKDRFISIIAHDLRSPFFGILGLTELVANQAETMSRKEMAGCVAMVYKSVQNVYALVDDLLKWAAMDQGRMEFRPEDWGLDELLDHVVGPLRAAMDRKKLTYVQTIEPGLHIHADRNQLETALRNLVSNAVKYTPGGGSVTVIASGETEGTLRISVEDTGLGMEPKELEKVLSGIKAQSQPGTEGERGSGLGLSLVKQVASRHGGRLEMASATGKGTQASLLLPRANI